MLDNQNFNKYIKWNYFIKELKNKNKFYLFFRINKIIIILSKYLSKVSLKNNQIILLLKNNKYLKIVISILKNYHLLRYKILSDLSVVDLLVLKYNKRFLITYNLLSILLKNRISLNLNIKQKEILPSISKIYSSANWLERENWDLFGIFFKNHPDLRRILTDYGFDSFPLRKDFPLSGYLELSYNEEKKLIIYKLLEVTQEFRLFNFISPWNNWKKNY